MRALIGAMLVVWLLWSAAHGAEIPPDAQKHLPTLAAAYKTHWPQAPLKHVAAGQVEQESDWKERATLKTNRELGRGLCQMTITKSFNIYESAVKWKALKGWDWRSDPYNPLYQLTFLVLQDRCNFEAQKAISDLERWKIALVRYNAGDGRIAARRRYALAKGLRTDRWTGGLEDAHGTLENSVLYGRPLWKAVNEYPRVIIQRAAKYEGRI